MTLLTDLRRRMAYRRTRRALMALPQRTREDCDLIGQEAVVAHRAVYGN